MARDNLFFKRTGSLNQKLVPAAALVMQGIWAAFLTLPRTVTTTVDPQTGVTKAAYGNVYTQLLEYIMSADLVFYALMVGAVVVMRRKLPPAERPYRTPGYPLVPLIYVGLALLLVIDLAVLKPGTSGIGYLLVLTGIPVYFWWHRKTMD
jgi:APA family basic amino acid/polyamine antiporter